MRQQLELAFELKFDLLDTIDWGKKQLVDFDEEKHNIDSFHQSNNSGAIDVKMDWSVLKKTSSFNILGVSFSSKLNIGTYIVSIVKTAFKKSGALVFSLKFLSFDVAACLCKATLYLYKVDFHRKLSLCVSWLFYLLLGNLRLATEVDM